jgi:hypothetical protein
VWGNPITDPEAFKLLLSYSPLRQLKKQAYAPMLVTAGLNDPRVTYWEPAKWVAPPPRDQDGPEPPHAQDQHGRWPRRPVLAVGTR